MITQTGETTGSSNACNTLRFKYRLFWVPYILAALTSMSLPRLPSPQWMAIQMARREEALPPRGNNSHGDAIQNASQIFYQHGDVGTGGINTGSGTKLSVTQILP